MLVYQESIDLSEKQSDYISSNDIDYVSTIPDAKKLAQIWKINMKQAEMGDPPPSIALMRTEYHKAIKQDENGRLFIDVSRYEETMDITGNVIDIIDLPAGFKFSDFTGGKSKVFSTPFEQPEAENCHTSEKIRVLTPLGCLKSRLANLVLGFKKSDQEIVRIHGLKLLCFYHIQDIIYDEGFRGAKPTIDELKNIIDSSDAKTAFTKYGIDLKDLYQDIALMPGVPDKFLEKEHPKTISYLESKYKNRVSNDVAMAERLPTKFKANLP